MTSNYSSRSVCRICHRPEAFFTCHRCQDEFCDDHINSHNDERSSKQWNEILSDHRQLEDFIHRYRTEPNEYPLIEQINKWERQSIRLIQQVAQDARSQIFTVLDDHLIQIEKSLEDLKSQMEQCRTETTENDDLRRQWTHKSDLLKDALICPKTIQLCEEFDDDANCFIKKIAVNIVQPNDFFERSAGNIRIVDQGQRLIHSQWSDHASARGQRDYLLGQHRLRLKIEELSSDRWVFIGVVSKDAPLNPISIQTATVYGFAGQNGFCENGIYRNDQINIYQSDMEVNDILEFSINCDEHFIRLTNQRTHRSHELHIDLKHCPLPWQLIIGLCCSAGDSIRILPCTYEE